MLQGLSSLSEHPCLIHRRERITYVCEDFRCTNKEVEVARDTLDIECPYNSESVLVSYMPHDSFRYLGVVLPAIVIQFHAWQHVLSYSLPDVDVVHLEDILSVER